MLTATEAKVTAASPSIQRLDHRVGDEEDPDPQHRPVDDAVLASTVLITCDPLFPGHQRFASHSADGTSDSSIPVKRA
jgi:hypothetical protein